MRVRRWGEGEGKRGKCGAAATARTAVAGPRGRTCAVAGLPARQGAAAGTAGSGGPALTALGRADRLADGPSCFPSTRGQAEHPPRER